jgi:hypothetical protein
VAARRTVLLPGVCAVCCHHRQCKLDSIHICHVILQYPIAMSLEKATQGLRFYAVYFIHMAGQSNEEWVPLSVAVQQ